MKQIPPQLKRYCELIIIVEKTKTKRCRFPGRLVTRFIRHFLSIYFAKIDSRGCYVYLAGPLQHDLKAWGPFKAFGVTALLFWGPFNHLVFRP